MARTYSRPWRTLGVLGLIIGLLYALVAAGAQWSGAQWSPKLALDLDGGTEFVLNAVPKPGKEGTITPETIQQAVKIIRQRVDGAGVAEAEITTQGANSIVVSLPGKNIDEATRQSIRKSAELEFRPVLAVQQPQSAEPTPSGSASASASASAGASASASASAKATSSPKATGSGAAVKPGASSSGGTGGGGLRVAAPSPTGAPSAEATPKASAAASPGASPNAKPTDASDLAWLTADLGVLWSELDCSTAEGRGKAQNQVNDPAKPFLACEGNGTKYALGPVEVQGRNITDATAGLGTNSQGQSTGEWEVNLSFDGTGADAFGKVTKRLFDLDEPRNRFAIVLDNQVISAPRTLGVIPDGRAQITGDFTQDSSQALANQLKFGALPISFAVATESEISATLGSEQLRNGLLAGLIGLLLVVAYSLAQYRALGLVTVSSLLVAGVITYGVVLLLGWRQGYRLSLPGIAGLIVAIGITADSFIVYFERIRDEVREGRSLTSAVEMAWLRARRTILISDAVSLLAAVVLYLLAVGGVRGFAFTLGLTTLIDVLVVFMFTKPMVTLLSRTHFFGGGHKLSGFDAEHLGRAVQYAGRGAIRTAPRTRAAAARPGEGTTIAERRAAERQARGTTAVLDEEN